MRLHRGETSRSIDILKLRGTPVLSAFRRTRLLVALHAIEPAVHDVYAEYWHFVQLGGDFSQDDHRTLDRLLEYGPRQRSDLPAGERLLVVPRFGTVSPWSTKATDIARRCGLASVQRIERGIVWLIAHRGEISALDWKAIAAELHDPMTESVLDDFSAVSALFEQARPRALRCIDILDGGRPALDAADREFGFALSDAEKDYLLVQFERLGRNPTDVELMMFAQVNSEHCRHKIFNADWIIDGESQNKSLFSLIRETHRRHPDGTLVAYADNAAVIEGSNAARLFADPASGEYGFHAEPAHMVVKVETHNHPTAIAPFPGAATGSGGEIRDEGATGRGAKPKAGITGFTVSDLHLPDAPRPWELPAMRPARIASALRIMLEGPLGAATFGNEFGRPCVGGYFRTFEQQPGTDATVRRGYHKPIMLAGGIGTIRPAHIAKQPIATGAAIVVLGGPAMPIGLGGGAASSLTGGAGRDALDFASVQRSNPEMQRRCQEVIDQCCAMGADNPIVSIHDVGAGGLSNALPELVAGAGGGAHVALRAIPADDSGMTPLEIWCNEAQERYVLAVAPQRLAAFAALCERERCLYAVVGEAIEAPRLTVADGHFADRPANPASAGREAIPIDLELALLFGEPPGMCRAVQRVAARYPAIDTATVQLDEAVKRVLRLPAVADKTFLVTIADRSVSGLVHRDPMVGPWQVPVADVGVTLADYTGCAGEAVAIGERPPLALIDAPASGRMAVGEALTNIAAARIGAIGRIKLSANWMVPAGWPGEDTALYDTVRAVALELCPALGISIPVGKDSMSMQTRWPGDDGIERAVVAPLSLVVTAFAPVEDVRQTVTPQLQRTVEPATLLLVDLGAGRNRLGGSALAQVYNRLGGTPPDVDDPLRLRGFYDAMQVLLADRMLLAYHDRSDGGLFTTLCEMAFAARLGLEIDLPVTHDVVAALFNEELGAVLQVLERDLPRVRAVFGRYGLAEQCHVVGRALAAPDIVISAGGREPWRRSRSELQRLWSETSWHLRRLRDDPDCADQEYAAIVDMDDPGLHAKLTFDPGDDVAAPFIGTGARPRIAVLREQGVNGQVEMAAAFHRAGFTAVDVTMSDLDAGRVQLDGFQGLAACGGFSFGDVLGAGQGWAKSILFKPVLRAQFEAFFAHPGRFALGVCNGCQMFAGLRELIAGAGQWPEFVPNRSAQYESRLVMVEVLESRSILFAGMAGSRFPVVVSHSEGQAVCKAPTDLAVLQASGQVALRFVDHHGQPTARYPCNPNGSAHAITGLTTADGRVTILMPHPERNIRSATVSWHPAEWGEDSPWLRLFQNARAWIA